MSRATVRQAIVNYLNGANVTGLTTVFGFPPKLTPEGDFYNGSDPNHKSGAIIYLYLEQERENRIAFGGPHDGRKMVEYTWVMDCYFRSTTPKSEDAGQANEAFLDSLVAAIRADRNAGAPGTIFQWGEGTLPGSPDIDVTSYYPRNINGAASVTQTYSQLRVIVLEEIES